MVVGFLFENLLGCCLCASFGVFPLLESLASVGFCEVLEDGESEFRRLNVLSEVRCVWWLQEEQVYLLVCF